MIFYVFLSSTSPLKRLKVPLALEPSPLLSAGNVNLYKNVTQIKFDLLINAEQLPWIAGHSRFERVLLNNNNNNNNKGVKSLSVQDYFQQWSDTFDALLSINFL